MINIIKLYVPSFSIIFLFAFLINYTVHPIEALDLTLFII